MADTTQEYSCDLPASILDSWDWHARPGAFDRLRPPWESMRLVERNRGLDVGARTIFQVKKGGIWLTWEANHTECEAPNRWVDEQGRGPFASWRHEHRFESTESGQCQMTDHIQWRPPGGLLGRVAIPSLKSTNDALFAFRHQRTRNDLTLHARFSDQPRRTIAVTGATGLVGSALCSLLSTGGHRVIRIVRRGEFDTDCVWDIPSRTIESEKLTGVDAIVHLAGAPIAQPWTPEVKADIRDSRVQGTELIVQTIAAMENRPEVLISGSALGYYGNAGETVCDESTEPGAGFLGDVATAWEAAAQPVTDLGVRLVTPRIGIVNTAIGGALHKMLPAFRAGTGGPIASGKQWVSWIALDDLLGMLLHAILDPAWHGPFNATSPNPIRQADQAHTLGRVLRRPAITPLPLFALRTLFGEMGEHLIAEGQRVVPARAQDLGYPFLFPDYEAHLRFTLGVC